ncbi:hypothetical protein [Flagellimonas nanhaiensis]|uniref:Membrane metalloprotease n=1 Tax=Flagellimonas nanhaiensis TaxID=2292706 RepID=A0A371JSG4_9FLAO|nr:hypothetical protein [Allomuricauda nanhaiensis]RDY60744.1 hypothetical protein DX873_00755 [Allomuricauda nanhaiensis]
MKKKNNLLLLFLTILLLGCSSDNGGSSPNGGVDKSANLLATGASANDILANNNFDDLLIEIAYVAGFRPTTETVSNFENFLRERTFKQDINFIYQELPSPNEETLTLNEIADLETDNRTAYNDGRTLAIYIYFADAPSDEDDESQGAVTLGAVYRNTSMIIYEETIRNLLGNSTLISLADVETATLNHEFGHLFGLVNLGTDPVNDHEETELNENDQEVGNNHCNVQGCLMRSELQFGGSMMKMMERSASKGAPAVPELDAECILDLQNNGGR